MKLKFIVAMTMMLVFCSVAMGTELYQSQDFWGPDSFFDIRTYHESHPNSDKARNHGGWIIGITFPHDGNGDELVDSVEISSSASPEGARMVVDYKDPMTYPWIGTTFDDYSLFLGHRMIMGETFTITPKDHAGQPIDLIMDDGSVQNSFVVSPSFDHALPPVCKVKRMAIKKDGQLMVKFTAPYDLRNNHIRIRIFDAANVGAEVQFRYDPPYQITKKDGTIVPDKMKILLPGEYAGRQARIEYRTYEDDTGFMSRGITYVVLPSLEE